MSICIHLGHRNVCLRKCVTVTAGYVFAVASRCLILYNQKFHVESKCYWSRTGIFQNINSGSCNTRLN